MGLNASEFADMFGKIHTNSNSQSSLDQKFAAQKEYLNRLKIENDEFFNLIIKVFTQKLEWEHLKEQLLKAAKENGFDDVAHALNQIQNIHGKSPLHNALQKQDFASAKQLMDLGAKVGPIEKAAFELACDSQAAREYGVNLPSVEKFHPVKNFGLVLGIKMTLS